MSAQITIQGVNKKFETADKSLTVLNDISFSVKEGEIISILGRSGSGKTTLLNIIAGLDDDFLGKSITEGFIAYAPQQDLLLPWRTILRNILLPLEIKRKITLEDEEKASQLLITNGLGDVIHSYPSELSGGMRQKVSLVRALLQNTDIVLFDEPFSAIDFDTRLKLGKDVRSQIVKNKKIGIFVTHNIEEAISMGDRVFVIGGKPSHIIHESTIAIPEESRDPVKIRETSDFKNIFNTLWQLLDQKN